MSPRRPLPNILKRVCRSNAFPFIGFRTLCTQRRTRKPFPINRFRTLRRATEGGVASRFPFSLLRFLSPPNPFRMRTYKQTACFARFWPKLPSRNSFRIRTYKNFACKPFRMRSSEKRWGEGASISNASSQRSKRFISFCRRNLPTKSILVNSTPRPWPGMMSRTTASARTFPPGTSKASLTFVPTGGGSGVEINKPPMPSVLTREKSWRSPPYQLTGIPLGSDTRGYRRVGQGGCSVTEGKAASCHQRTCPGTDSLLSTATSDFDNFSWDLKLTRGAAVPAS